MPNLCSQRNETLMNFARDGFRAAYVKHTIWSNLYNQGTGSTQPAFFLRDCSPCFFSSWSWMSEEEAVIWIVWVVMVNVVSDSSELSRQRNSFVSFERRETRDDYISKDFKSTPTSSVARSFRATCIITRCNLRHKLQFSVIIQAFFPRPGYCFNDIVINWM